MTQPPLIKLTYDPCKICQWIQHYCPYAHISCQRARDVRDDPKPKVAKQTPETASGSKTKPVNMSFRLRMDTETHSHLKQLAKRNGVSMNAMVNFLINRKAYKVTNPK